jgi:hypothetical protein
MRLALPILVGLGVWWGIGTTGSVGVQTGVAATTIVRLARTDDKAASALSLDLASKIVTVLDCGIEDLLEVIETL